jgi:hypothetical protein
MDAWLSNDIREAPHVLNAGDRNDGGWLHQRVGPAFDALRADRSKEKSAHQLRVSVATRIAGLAPPSSNKNRCDSTTAYTDFIAAHNALVAVHGLPLAKHRMF